MGLGFGLASTAQSNIVTGKKYGELPANFKMNKSMVVEDTLLQPLFGTNCDPSLYGYSIGGSDIVGTFQLNATDGITEIAQLLNLSSRTVEVESLLFFVNNKKQGSNPGSFSAMIYDTLGGPSPLRPDYNAEATSQSISFASLDTAFPGINRFTFATPYQTSEPFWAALSVDNGSDTISVYSSSDECGGQQPTSLMNVNDTLWLYYASVFQASQNNPLDFAIWVWAEVDTADGTVGLNRNFISNAGLDFYPNPATDEATIEFHMPAEQKVTLVIQDMSGREVYRSEQEFYGTERKFEVNLSTFENGPYTYQVIGEKRQLNGVFVKR